MNRRGFLTKAGLFLGTVGVADSFKLDLLDKLSRSLIPNAQADLNPPIRMVEICLRSGFPITTLAQSKQLNSSDKMFANFNHANNGTARPMPTNAVSAKNIIYNTDSQVLLPFADNIAVTQGIEVDPTGHSALFDYRRGGAGGMKVSQAVETSNLNTTSSLVTGVIFPRHSGGDVSNSVADQKDMEQVRDVAAFKTLFKSPRLRLTASETGTVLDAANSLSAAQALKLEGKLKEATRVSGTQANAAALFTTDFTQALNVTSNMPEFFNFSIMSQNDFESARERLATGLKAMSMNLINSLVVTIDFGDIHAANGTALALGPMVSDLSNLIANTIKYLKATNEPTGSGLKLWDTTTLVVGSEFTRGLSPADGASDNPDGATQGLMIVGKRIRGDFYGGYKFASGYGQDMTLGFDPASGQTYSADSGKRNTSSQAYQTIRMALGLPMLTTEKEQVLKCMVVQS